jgi:hypothetical protein
MEVMEGRKAIVEMEGMWDAAAERIVEGELWVYTEE